MTVYIGAADGGIWKTSDAGNNWSAVFDDKDVSAIGALAVAPSSHEVAWAGTGEPWFIRPYYTLGDGAIAAQFKQIVDVEAPAFNALLKRNGVVTSIVP